MVGLRNVEEAQGMEPVIPEAFMYTRYNRRRAVRVALSRGGAREGESVVIVNVTLLSIICGGASCRGQDLSGWCPAAVGMCSTPMGGPPQLWMTKLRVSCGFYELVVTSPTEKR